MKIELKLVVNDNYKLEKLELSDLGLNMSQWNALGDEEKRMALQEYADDLPDQPYWSLDRFEEI